MAAADSQRPIVEVTTEVAWVEDTFEDNMKCRLLMAAVFHCSGECDKSDQFADDVLKNCGRYRIAYYRQVRELGGIARLIWGTNLMALKDWESAYWSFSRALHTPGYHVKAQHLQRETMESLMREEASRSGPGLQPPQVNSAFTKRIPTTPPSTQVPESWESPRSVREVVFEAIGCSPTSVVSPTSITSFYFEMPREGRF